MRTIKRISLVLLSMFMTVAGVNHFLNPDFYLKIMPNYLPLHLELVYFSGVCEIAGGLGLLVPKLRRAAAWGIIALLIAIFPANVYVFQHQDVLPAPPIMHLLRLPLQAYSFSGPGGILDRKSSRRSKLRRSHPGILCAIAPLRENLFVFSHPLTQPAAPPSSGPRPTARGSRRECCAGIITRAVGGLVKSHASTITSSLLPLEASKT